MKSRKLGFFGKRILNRRTSDKQSRSRQALRTGLIEKLEDRQMMASDWNAAIVGSTGLFTNNAARSAVVNYVSSRGVNSPVALPAGEPTTVQTIFETEPNNGPAFAQAIPLTNANGVILAGNNTNVLDEDWSQFTLNAGDILDVRLNANASATLPLLTLYNSSNVELISSAGLSVGTYPANSPLTGSLAAPAANAGLSYIVGQTGTYRFRLSDVTNTYTLTFRALRPPMESQPAGTMQTLFLDFDGAIFTRTPFGFGPGSARISPFGQSLPGYGLLPTDEAALINEVTQRVQAKFNDLQQRTTNSNFALRIINSSNSLDPWGAANVSRVVIGGNWQEFTGLTTANPGLLGIAQSVDVGNFNTTETAIVMQDVLQGVVNAVPIAGGATRIQLIGELIASVVAHEAGHFFGGLHQTALTPQGRGIMDQFFVPGGFAGVGLDGIFGTADDTPLRFVSAPYTTYVPITPNNGGQPLGGAGVNDNVAYLGWGLSGGRVGGRINGNVYHDRNLSRTRDNGDTPLGSVRVFADLNNNGTFESNEFSALTDAAGNYSILVPAGTYNVRTVVTPGYRLTAPLSGVSSVTVVGTNTVSNINFGKELLSTSFTGVKWNDVNGNGLRDPGEGGLANTRIYLDLDGDGRIDLGEPTSKSDANGNYTITFPGPGTYTIREVIDPGYIQTFPGPAANFSHVVTVTGNPAVDTLVLAGLNFGNQLNVDFGDAPASYGIASAGFVPGLSLGTRWDAEQTSQFSANATGDDINGLVDPITGATIDDEDGVVFTRPIVVGSSTNRAAITVTNTTGVTGYLNAWIDFNQDGDFSDAGEQIFTNQVVNASTVLNFTAPASAAVGSTFARFRYSAEQNVGPTGQSMSGEVEDYAVNVVAQLVLAVDDSFTVARNSALNSLNVLANDFALPGDQLEIVTTSASTAGGVVQVSSTNQILYTPPPGFIGRDIFTYTMRNSSGETGTATVAVDVRLFFNDPQAVDDSFDVAINAIDFPLNVLANDIEGVSGALTIIMVSQPSGGGRVDISSGGKALRYTPVRNFNSTETFTYVVADPSGKQSTARVTLHTLPYSNINTDVIYSLVATDLNGNPITAIPQGQQFRVEFYADDFRDDRGAPVAAPGVFAAYIDLLYNMQLVSTVSPTTFNGLNFEASFFNGYTNATSGDAAIPGLINEFGAFNVTGVNADPGSMNFPNRVRVATATFVANSAGLARFTPDPADRSPDNDTLLFDPGTEVPVPRIRYLSTSLQIVGDSAQFPQAVDDSFPTSVPFGAVRFPLNVIANDLPGSTGSISVTGVTNGLSGFTSIDNQGRVLYTPNGGFSGTDQFQYTIQDARGISSTATVTVRVGDADANDIVALPLRVTDVNGSPITSIAVGGEFQLRGYVRDLRTNAIDPGVFAAYADVLINGANLVSTIATPVTDLNPLGFRATFGQNYTRVTSGDNLTRGLLNEMGAVQTGDVPLGTGEQLLFIVTFRANSVGTVSFVGDPADISPRNDTLTYNPVEVVGFDRIRFGFTGQLNITPTGNLGGGEFTNRSFPEDVNADGFVSPIDALAVINAMNRARRSSSASGEGEASRMFIDVNGDNRLSPIDALLVINFLSRNRGAQGEGEAASSDPVSNLQAQAGTFASSTNANVNDDTVQVVAPEGEAASTGITLSPTHEDSYVPTSGNASATDSVFACDSSGLDDLLSQLAFDVESNLKKKVLA